MQDAKKNTLSASQRGEIVPPILVQILYTYEEEEIKRNSGRIFSD